MRGRVKAVIMAFMISGMIVGFIAGWMFRGEYDSKPQLTVAEIRVVVDDLGLTQPLADMLNEKILELQKARREAGKE